MHGQGGHSKHADHLPVNLPGLSQRLQHPGVAAVGEADCDRSRAPGGAFRNTLAGVLPHSLYERQVRCALFWSRRLNTHRSAASRGHS